MITFLTIMVALLGLVAIYLVVNLQESYKDVKELKRMFFIESNSGKIKDKRLSIVSDERLKLAYTLDKFIELSTKATLKKIEKLGFISYAETKTGFEVYVVDTDTHFVFSNKTKKAKVIKEKKSVKKGK